MIATLRRHGTTSLKNAGSCSTKPTQKGLPGSATRIRY
jgi:hypothetical protein